MAVKKLGNGKWLAKISFRDDDGKVQSHEKRFRTKNEAKEYEVEFKKSLQHSSPTSSNYTYKNIFDEYISDAKIKVTDKTLKDKIYFANTYCSHLFHRKYISISKKDWLDVYNSILKTDLSVSRKNTIISTIKSISKFAYTYFDFEDRTKLLKLLEKSKKMNFKVWTPDEFNKVMDYEDNGVYKLFFKTLFNTGARRDEIRLITKDEIRLSKAILYIKPNKYRNLKNLPSERDVPISESLALELKELLNVEGEFLFGGLEPLKKSTIDNRFKRAIKLSKVKPIKLHDLRHSHASILISKGINIVAISRRLGHSNIGETMRTYTHLMKEDEEKLVELINKI